MDSEAWCAEAFEQAGVQIPALPLAGVHLSSPSLFLQALKADSDPCFPEEGPMDA